MLFKGIRSVKSIPILISLLDEGKRGIPQKAEYILGTYESEAIDYFRKLYENSNSVPNRIYAVKLLGNIDDEATLIILGKAL